MNSDIENQLRRALIDHAERVQPSTPPRLAAATTLSQRPTRTVAIGGAAVLVAASVALVVVVGRGDQREERPSLASAAATSGTFETPAITGPRSSASEVPVSSTDPTILKSGTIEPESATTTSSDPYGAPIMVASQTDVSQLLGPTLTYLPGDINIDLGLVGTTPVRIEQTTSSRCVYHGDGAGCSRAADGSIDTSDGWESGGGGSVGGPYFHYWLVPNGVQVAVVNAAGSSDCEMTGVPLTALGDMAIWMCETQQGLQADDRIVFLRGDIAYATPACFDNRSPRCDGAGAPVIADTTTTS